MVTFKNGSTYETIVNMGGSEIYQGQQRQTLAYTFNAAEVDYDEIKAIFKDTDALSEVTVAADGQSSLKLNFSIPIELKVHSMQLSNDSTELTEVITMKVAQRSALEIQQDAQAEEVAMLTECILEMSETIYA